MDVLSSFLLVCGIALLVCGVIAASAWLSSQNKSRTGKVLIQYRHQLTHEEADFYFDTYRRTVCEACVETWLVAANRTHDLRSYRNWTWADTRFSTELGLIVVAPSHNEGDEILLTMIPDRHTVPALQSLLESLNWYAVQTIPPKEQVQSIEAPDWNQYES